MACAASSRGPACLSMVGIVVERMVDVGEQRLGLARVRGGVARRLGFPDVVERMVDVGELWVNLPS